MTTAYVFWHRPRADVDAAGYVDALAAFHASLAESRPGSLLASWSLALAEAPWPEGGEGWLEDWYVLRGIGGLGALERAAIDARRRGAHDAAAAGTGEGTAGIYGLVHGSPVLEEGGSVSAAWLAKPEGEPYDSFIGALVEAGGPAASVWQRRLTLGPTPEFAVLGSVPELPWSATRTGPQVAVPPSASPLGTGVTLRAARADEAEALSELAVRSKGHWGYDAAFLARARAELTVRPSDIERFVIRVAEERGRLLGFSAVDIEGTPAELLALWVDPVAIGTGVGRALLTDALGTAAEQGAGGLFVESDPNAEGFYLHHGARRLGERRSRSTKRLLPLLWVPA
jgi:N-acetylglutamate synthase-like GNAT family acetyltransferase